jgi:hypothetical protein
MPELPEADRPIGYVSEADIEAMKMDRHFIGGSGPEQAKKILAEASPAAAMQIAKLSLHADNPSVRLRASQYILDRTIVDDGSQNSKDPWDKMMEEMVAAAKTAEVSARPTDNGSRD